MTGSGLAPTRLRLHLRSWLGRWPPASLVDVVGSVQRTRPGWDGRTFPLIAIGAPDAVVLSVPPSWAPVVRQRVHAALAGSTDWRELVPALPSIMNRPDQPVYNGVFRFSEKPADYPDAGIWLPTTDPLVPTWLQPFNHEVLIAFDDAGRYLAGVGIKHHDRYGQELAVGTEPAARGQGLARRLVAQAARRVLDEGAIPTYQHDPRNLASAHVADAAGFPDQGWRSLGMP
jgi:GNAT superfamily N-acetyltransferase